ncbi:hypothetical protein BZB76_1896 [Actinomadura pelletieri DSM 43383]|uniref:Uncharacterized protein n=1 Tax=Actinomadura pelletieri DSM 43383 TaxID=1120940 RepID=A0A495QSQ7_9ACTN|nr:hypothetical protein [Actinomadura pelletieri]RKS76540.1 hypothetical protein BZB76_1896 [Actinomadura pelletieri DSM 43383]
MPVTHDNGVTSFNGRAFSIETIRCLAVETDRVDAGAGKALTDALRRRNAERRGTGVTEAGFDSRLDRGWHHP